LDGLDGHPAALPRLRVADSRGRTVFQSLRRLCLIVMGALLAAWVMARESDGMSADELARFNGLPAAAARDELLACCHSPTWADRMLTGRPYSSARDAVRQSSAIVARMPVPDLEVALAGHPRIGQMPVGRDKSAEWSRQEQSGVATADAETAMALAESSEEYERRFGHIYLVSAAGRTGQQLLALLRARLRNSPETEWQVVRTELQKINEIRLREMLAGTP
jgi:2-oxo-4-hydroxy-4-carboxy-5-ureidoimidazoline decarboxylase